MQPTPETWISANGMPITIRPISADDLALERSFVGRLSASTGYKRLMSARHLSSDDLRRLTDLDPERELALIATMMSEGSERQIGVARYVKDGQAGNAEFAIVLSDEWQGKGLGTRLLGSLIGAAKTNGVKKLVGTTLSDNRGMLSLARKLGFKTALDSASATVTHLTLDLATWPPADEFRERRTVSTDGPRPMKST